MGDLAFVTESPGVETFNLCCLYLYQAIQCIVHFKAGETNFSSSSDIVCRTRP